VTHPEHCDPRPEESWFAKLESRRARARMNGVRVQLEPQRETANNPASSVTPVNAVAKADSQINARAASNVRMEQGIRIAPPWQSLVRDQFGTTYGLNLLDSKVQPTFDIPLTPITVNGRQYSNIIAGNGNQTIFAHIDPLESDMTLMLRGLSIAVVPIDDQACFTLTATVRPIAGSPAFDNFIYNGAFGFDINPDTEPRCSSDSFILPVPAPILPGMTIRASVEDFIGVGAPQCSFQVVMNVNAYPLNAAPGFPSVYPTIAASP